MTAHPTPWGINDDGDVVDEGGELVAINPRTGPFPGLLIAAAPKLYQAGRSILDHIDNPKTRIRQTDIDSLRTALDEAEGRS